jgi:hypothetical protein
MQPTRDQEKKTRNDTTAQMNATNVAGATHFYFALQVEWHYKLAPGTFAGIDGSRLTSLSTEKKEICCCLMHMMMKELRSSSAGAACTQVV